MKTPVATIKVVHWLYQKCASSHALATKYQFIYLSGTSPIVTWIMICAQIKCQDVCMSLLLAFVFMVEAVLVCDRYKKVSGKITCRQNLAQNPLSQCFPILDIESVWRQVSFLLQPRYRKSPPLNM